MQRFLALLMITTIVALSACGPKPELPATIEPPASAAGPAPSELSATADNSSALLKWKTNQPENRLLSGYNVYMARENGDFEKTTPMPYPGDLDPGYAVESFPATGLQNGVSYRFMVSTVYPNGTEEFAADTVEVIPRPQGRIQLQASFRGQQAGFSFGRLTSVPTDDFTNDVYLAIIKGKGHLASPNRINVVLRETKFYPILRQPSAQPERRPRPVVGDGKELIAIKAGDQLYLQTEDNCYALVRVENVDLKEESAELSYVYQTRPNTLIF